MTNNAFDSCSENKAYQRYVENALDVAEKNLASSLSPYESMETAFEQLLEEDPTSKE